MKCLHSSISRHISNFINQNIKFFATNIISMQSHNAIICSGALTVAIYTLTTVSKIVLGVSIYFSYFMKIKTKPITSEI